MALNGLRPARSGAVPPGGGPEGAVISVILDGELYVRVTAFSRVDRIGPVRGWQPLAAAAGQDPADGEDCVIQRVGRDIWLLGWEPTP